MFLGICCCIVLPFNNKLFKSPSSHVLNRLSRHALCSLAFDLEEGFCSHKIGRATAAFIAVNSMVELEANALYILARSETKDFPDLPKETLKRFGLQYTTSLQTALRKLMKVKESREPQIKVDIAAAENAGSSKGNAGAVQHGGVSGTQLVDR